MQRSAQFDAAADDLVFLELDDRRDDIDLRFRARAFANHVLEGAVILGAAVRIAGAVFGDRADVDRVRALGFGPAHGHAEKMRVAERDVGDWNFADVWCGRRVELIFGHGDVLIGEGGSADGAEVIELDAQTTIGRYGVEIGDFGKGAAFARLRALAIAGV